MIVLVPTFCLLALLLTTQILSQFTDSISDVSTISAMQNQVDHSSLSGSGDTEPNDSNVASSSEVLAAREQTLYIVFWVILLPVLFLVLGTVVGSLVYLVVYYRYRAEQDWSVALTYSMLIWMALVVLFEFILTTPLYRGLLQSYLLDPYLSF